MKIRLFGTEIYISFLFAAIIAFVLYTDKTGLALPTGLAVILHEMGHLLAMKALCCAPREIRLIPASVQLVKPFCARRGGEAIIALSGPVANIIFFLLFYGAYLLWGGSLTLLLAALNIILAVFNLLPVSGLDGGTLLRLFLEKRHPNSAALAVKITTAALSATVFLLGVYLWSCGSLNLSLFVLALYLAVCVFIKT